MPLGAALMALLAMAWIRHGALAVLSGIYSRPRDLKRHAHWGRSGDGGGQLVLSSASPRDRPGHHGRPLGASAIALIYQFMINDHGWRSTFLTLAVLLLTLVVVPTAVFMRRQPEDFGLLPDGALAPAPAEAAP